MAYWLLKTEPDDYHFGQLMDAGQTVWDGVANAMAVNYIKTMHVGDECVIYHTGDERRCAGIARVVSEPYPDPLDATRKLVVVDVAAVRALHHGCDLATIKAAALFADSYLVRMGRLSVVPLTPAQYAFLTEAR
ncbi:MAG: EVE domain-containing protein [Roseiflexaceae bacterium]|jgi:predicted RNA-binding protein with PUA-like domain